jgi:C4-dicarboxylate-binding protein DctP
MAQLVLKFGGYQPPESINTRSAARFLESLEARLGARVSCELIGSVLDLGRPSGDLVPMVENGELSFCFMSAIRFSEKVPGLRVFELPFVVKDRAGVFQALDGELGDRLKAGVEATTGCKVLGFWDNGFRHVTNRVRPIRTPADCEGLAIRTQMTPLHGETFAALGFKPVPVDIKEFVEQIDTDRFDAQENPLANTYAFGVQKHHRYITLTGHLFGISLMVCNRAQFDAWPADVQQAVIDAAHEATAHQRQLAIDEDEQVLSRLDPAENEVIELTEAERQRFVDAVQPVLAKHPDDLDPEVLTAIS